MDLLCAYCLRQGDDEPAVTIRDGTACCRRHTRRRRETGDPAPRVSLFLDGDPITAPESPP